MALASPNNQNQVTPPIALPSVNWLRLRHYRNFPELTVTTAAAMVAIVGANGVGKTNILEALSLLAVGRGLRRAALGDLQHQNAMGKTAPENWSLSAQIVTARGEWVIGSGSEAVDSADSPANAEKTPRLKRLIKIDGRITRGQRELGEILSVAWLTPDMDRLFRDSAQMRRNYVDRLVLALSPAHGEHVATYSQAMRERSRLLRNGYGQSTSDRAWLGALEETMAAEAVAIAAERLSLVAGINHAALDAPNDADLNLPIPVLVLTGFVEEILRQDSALIAEEKFRAVLESSRRSDAESGITQFGIHRSDLVTTEAHRGVSADKLSTGEQKTLLLAIQFAQARLIKSVRGHPPLLLLDDLPAHLDKNRLTAFLRQALALGGQIFVTGTEATDFHPIEQDVQIIALT